jgi:thymidylate synthase
LTKKQITVNDQLDTDIKKLLSNLYTNWEDQNKLEVEYYKKTFEDLKIKIITEISKNKSSRKLYFNLWDQNQDDNDLSVKSPCLVGVYFRIFGNTIDMQVIMRANNAFKISLINFSIFVDFYREIANALLLKTGTYSHFATSYHIYNSDLASISNNNYLKSKNIKIN